VSDRDRFTIGLCIGLCLLAPSRLWAGAWTLDAGSGQVFAGGLISTSSEIFDASRQLQPIPRYNKLEGEAFLEYGVTDRFTLMVGPGLQHIDIAAPVSAERTGLGYTELGGRYRLLLADSWVASGQVLVRVPGTFDNSNPAAIGFTDVQTDVRALLGRTFSVGKMPAFIDLELAQRFRGGGAPDELRADATFGIRPAPRWLLLAQSFNVISEGAGSWGFPSYDYYKLQLSAVYELTPSMALQVGGFTAYMGRNALQENGLVLGGWFKF
jgi:hypothetical protein